MASASKICNIQQREKYSPADFEMWKSFSIDSILHRRYKNPSKSIIKLVFHSRISPPLAKKLNIFNN